MDIVNHILRRDNAGAWTEDEAEIQRQRQRAEMEDGEDEDYMNFSNAMKAAARDIVDAVKLNDAERASKAVSEISKACTECHEYYRA